MKITAIATMAVMTAVVAQAGETVLIAKLGVTVCMDGGPGLGVTWQARTIASKMFAAIRVTVDWREGLAGCPAQGILINLTDQTPPALFPGALAYALPFEGSHIRLFYDRIAQDRPALLLPHLLAHVLVHEITHVLQGISQHSSEGVMKARWTPDDFYRMMGKPLPFTTEDIDRIHRGLAARAERSTGGEELSASLRPAGPAGKPLAVAAR